jgi:hypothetical protein
VCVRVCGCVCVCLCARARVCACVRVCVPGTAEFIFPSTRAYRQVADDAASNTQILSTETFMQVCLIEHVVVEYAITRTRARLWSLLVLEYCTLSLLCFGVALLSLFPVLPPRSTEVSKDHRR